MANYSAMPLMYGNTPVQYPQSQSFMDRAKGFWNNPDLAMALLANSGYSLQKRTFGEILGTSMLQANQLKQGRTDDEFKRQYMQAQMAAMRGKQQGPASVQEYEYAKKNGYQGSFQDWTVAAGQSSRPSSVIEWEHYQNLLNEDKKNGTQNARAYLEMKRSPPFKIESVQGAPTAVFGTPGGGIQATPLSTLSREAAAAETIATAKGVGQTVGEAQGAQASKSPAKSSMDYVLAEFRKTIPKTTQGGLFGIVGKAGTVFDKKDKERFNNLREQLSTELRTVFRIPGEGTLSDREQAQYGIQLPSTDYETETNEQILSDIENRVRLRTETPIGNAPSAGPRGGNTPLTFATEAEAEAAGIKPGTRVVIGGVPGTWQ
jgi:hypothetical protein